MFPSSEENQLFSCLDAFLAPRCITIFHGTIVCPCPTTSIHMEQPHVFHLPITAYPLLKGHMITLATINLKNPSPSKGSRRESTFIRPSSCGYSIHALF